MVPPIEDAPDCALLAVRDVERSIRCLRNAVGPCDGFGRAHERILARETVREDLKLTRRLTVRKRLEGDVVAIHRHWRAVPRSVERDERAAPVLLWKLIARVEHHVH